MSTTETVVFILKAIIGTAFGLFVLNFLRSAAEEIRSQRIDKILRDQEDDAWRRRLLKENL